MGKIDKILRIAAYAAMAALVPLVVFFVNAWRNFPVLPDPGEPGVQAGFPRPAFIHEAPWSVVAPDQPAVLPAPDDSLSKRFRLAGTLLFASPDARRRAILDDLVKNKQHMLSEGESTGDGVVLVEVFEDRAVLRNGAVEETIFLDFASKVPGDRALPESIGARDSGVPAEGLSFGVRTGETRWELSREKMMSYYHEVMDDPERLIRVFDSFKPLYDEDKRITGYILDIEGESDMFEAFGLNEGDIIRKLNAMDMISQSRGEYFIREFVEERVNAFVLDIERNGEPRRQTYLVR